MNLKNYAKIVVCVLMATHAYGQTIERPQVIPASPSAVSLQKFGVYPVSLNTGLPDISVPIYTIESDSIKVPIELKYHASGIRYDTSSGAVGVGWTLFAGGMISAVTMGILDNPGSYNFFKTASSIDPRPNGTNSSDHLSMRDVVEHIKDSEYDVFNYSFLNYSGKFFYPGTIDPILTPRRNFKITRGNSGFPGMLSHVPITILDEDGISYSFGKSQDPNQVSVAEHSFTNPDKVVNVLLTEIVSADKSDTVRFNYTSLNVGFPGSSTIANRIILDDYTEIWDHQTQLFIVANPHPFPIISPHSHNVEQFNYCRLDNIQFKEGRVAFDYDSSNKLTKISIYNKKDLLPIKTALFTQTAYGADYFKLDEIKFENIGSLENYSYKFGYNGIPYNKLSGLDYWGFYNGTSEPVSYMPNFNIEVDGVMKQLGTADREPNEIAMQKGILNKIIYPTGGYSEFTYEAHRSAPNKIAGGLRIKSIENFDAGGVMLGKKWYAYGENESGYGIPYKDINPEDFCYTYFSPYMVEERSFRQFASTYRKRVFSPFPSIDYLTPGSSVTYDYVTEYNGDGINSNGKTTYFYENIPDNLDGPRINGPIPLVYRSNLWKSGQLLGKWVYKKNTNGDYSLLSSLINEYQDLHSQEYQCLKVIRYLDWPEEGFINLNFNNQRTIEETFTFSTAEPLYFENLFSLYTYADYKLSTGIRALTKSTEIVDGVNRITTYLYDDTYDKPKEIHTDLSNLGKKVTTYLYPFNRTTTPYTTMVSRNILNPVIEQSEYKENTNSLIKSTINEYGDWGNFVIAPLTLSTKTGGLDPEIRLHYYNYDSKGNVLSLSQEGGPRTSYKWGYNKQYPIAEAKNALENEVYSQDFEEPELGLDFEANVIYDPARPHTGKYSGRIDNGSTAEMVSHSSKKLNISLSAPKKFTFSGWVYSDGPSVQLFLFMMRPGETAYNSYVDNIQTTVKNKWVYLKKEFVVPADVAVVFLRLDNNAVGKVWFDDLRIRPSESSMSTYTYKPLIGMTSSIDNSGKTVYYEYDSFQRLKNIKDQNGNIIKNYDYHYKP